jgi:phage terminase Nu1 subunit (DNA packaging protein)
MDPRSIQRAVKNGLIRQVRRGLFVLGEAIPSYVEHLRASISNDPEEVKLRAAKLRRALAAAEKAELELQQLKSELHPTDVVLFVWSSRIGASRKRLLAIPNRLAPRLTGETNQQKIRDHIHNEITMALEDVAGLNEKDFVKEDRRFLRTQRSSNGE